MNFHKNYYKLFPISLLCLLAISLLGIAIAIIFGYNTVVAMPMSIGGLIFYIALYLVILSVFEIVYFKLRYNWSTGFTLVLKNFVDAFILFALIGLTRVPLTMYALYALIAQTVFSTITYILLIRQANENIKENTNSKDICNNTVASNFKSLLIITAVSIVTVLLLILTMLPNMYTLTLPAILAFLVSLVTLVLCTLPMWAMFVKRELKIKQKRYFKKEQAQAKAQEAKPLEEQENNAIEA